MEIDYLEGAVPHFAEGDGSIEVEKLEGSSKITHQQTHSLHLCQQLELKVAIR